MPAVEVESFLCVSPHPGGCPSEHFAGFEAEEHILAVSAGVTPVLWLALFRNGDLEADGTPIVARRRALSNLYAAVPVLDRLFAGSVAEHAELLREAMRWLPGATVTIEWWAGDVTPAVPPRADVSTVLDLIGGAPADDDDLAVWERITGLAVGSRIVPADLLLGGAPATEEQRAGLRRVLGRSNMRPVPWEIRF